MKTILLTLAMLFSVNALATVDVQNEVYIVVENVHESGDYFIQSTPAEYCVGDPATAVASGVTAPVTIKANYGCGHTANMISDKQINAATCAVVTASFEGGLNTNVTMDLSACGEKANNTYFRRALEEAVTKSMNVNGVQVMSVQTK